MSQAGKGDKPRNNFSRRYRENYDSIFKKVRTIKLTEEQIKELIEGDVLHTEERAGKHDCHFTDYVVKIDDKFYEFTLEFSYNNGIQNFEYEDFVEAYEVKPVEKVVTVWRRVK